jgi:hypothetical protein
LDEGEVVGGELVIARGDSPTLLDLVEEPLDQIASAVEVAAKADWLRPVSLWRDVGPCAVLANKCSDPIGVKCSIREQHGSRFQTGQQGEDKTIVVCLASGQRELDRQPTGIDNRMNLGRQSASRPAHKLVTVGCNAGSVLVHADDGRINHLDGRIVVGG